MGNLTPEDVEDIKKVVREEFAKLDTNKSGMLDKKELRNLLKKISKAQGEPFDEKSVDETFDQLDTDKSGKISLEEALDNWKMFALLIQLSKEKFKVKQI